MKKIILVLSLFSSITAFAGASNFSVKCKSASGRTNLEAWIPGDNPEQSVKVTVDGKSLTYINQDMLDTLCANNIDPQKSYPDYIVRDIAASLEDTKRIVVLITDGDASEPVLFFTVENLKKKMKRDGSITGTFQGDLVNTVDPRNLNAELPVIALSCSFSYSI